ncbi:MAG TPA: hypothetical protein VMI54_02980 [Polyangiaceae bacterium]|nr:hypothetical protein [Polyangiaceae bacterium]
MAGLTLGPINQCTLDDPTDGAEPPSFVPAPPDGTKAEPACHPAMPGAGGRPGDECTDGLVRRFSGEGGAPSAEELQSEPSSANSCFDEALRALSMCSPLFAQQETPQAFKVSQGVGCAGAVEALVACLLKKDEVR